MFTTLVRWFKAGQARPARRPHGLRFGLRLENLEGRAAPGALGFDHIGEEIPQPGGDAIASGGAKPGIISGSNEMTLGGDTGIQVDPTGGRGGMSGDFDVGVDLNGGRVVGSDFLYGVQVDPMGGRVTGSEFGLGIDPSSIKPGSSGDFGVGIDPSASKPTNTGDISFGVGIDPSASKPNSGGDINL
jgi:hypothetical protein